VKAAANSASSQIHKDPEHLETGVAIPTVDVPVAALVAS
jgi:hypothetical protein